MERLPDQGMPAGRDWLRLTTSTPRAAAESGLDEIDIKTPPHTDNATILTL